jgi:hypothetical protein
MIVTFYSFKGGVGRSMAVANVAEILADMGYRVVICDWDLEAPGLERYLVTNHADDGQYRFEMDRFLAWPGLMDLLVEYKSTLSQPIDNATISTEPLDEEFSMVGKLCLRRPSSYAQPVSTSRQKPGTLRLLPAGRRAAEALRQYAEVVRRFDWQDFYERWAGDAYIDFFRRDLVGHRSEGIDGAADLLLIDSRTGVTEQGGVCTHHLADLVVVMTAANDLNMEGAKWIVSALAAPGLTKLRGGRPLQVLPVAARIEQTAQRVELLEFRQRFLREFGHLLEWATEGPSAFALASEIPYMPFYSFHERVVAREPEGEREQLYAAYKALADGIVRCGIKADILREPTSEGVVARTSRTPSETAADAWDVSDFVTQLSTANAQRDPELVEELTARLERRVFASTWPLATLRPAHVLQMLRSGERFDLVQRLADALIQSGIDDPRVALLYTQSLVERGDMTAALGTLKTIVTESKNDSATQAEALAQIGRVHKQLYVEAVDFTSARSRRNLEQAVNHYLAAYRLDPRLNIWQGANVAALVLRARRDGISLEAAPDPLELARAVLEVVDGRDLDEQTFWDHVSAMEACLVLGAHDDALRWLISALRLGDRLSLQILHKQLTSIWGLQADVEPGAGLLPVLRAALLMKSARVEVTIPEVAAAAERPTTQTTGVTDETFGSVSWFRLGLHRCRVVGRIETTLGVSTLTGVLVLGSDLHASLIPEWLFLTTAHALGNAGRVASGTPDLPQAIVRFEGLDVGSSAPARRVKEIPFWSPPHALDFAIARLEPGIAGVDLCPIATEAPTISRDTSVYVIGAPGAIRSFSLTDHRMLDFDSHRLHYRSPTAPESSGSPVFNSRWELLGIHRSSGARIPRLQGSGTSEASEGTWIGAIQREIGLQRL